MELIERVGNIHIHTTASDGAATHQEIAETARRVGLDFVIVTDHNVVQREHEGWHGATLLLVGQELHNPANEHANHLLALNAGEDLAPLADDPQSLIDRVARNGGLSFLAHPFERSGEYSGEPEIDWQAWGVAGYTGIELWNYMSEFKSYLADVVTTLLWVFLPRAIMRGPYPETLSRWDELLASRPVWAIGGSDAHGTEYALGPLKRRVFGYEHLFRSLNTHVLVDRPWTGDVAQDGRTVYAALGRGRAFVAYDGLAPATGFFFGADHRHESHTMGDHIAATRPVEFHIRSPQEATLRLLLNGHIIAETKGVELTHQSQTPGAYRAEAYRSLYLRQRGWVYSNPIFVSAGAKGAASDQRKAR